MKGSYLASGSVQNLNSTVILLISRQSESNPDPLFYLNSTVILLISLAGGVTEANTVHLNSTVILLIFLRLWQEVEREESI